MDNIQISKPLYKKWWFWVIAAIIGASVYLTLDVFAPRANDKPKNPNFLQRITRPRVVKSFLPSTKAAFQYNTPTIINDYIYIGTSSRFAPEGDFKKNLNQTPANYFYKMDLNLNPIWKYELPAKQQTAGSASLDSKGNIYFVAEELKINKNQNSKEDNKGYLTNYYLYSLDKNGQLRWKSDISGKSESIIHGMINCTIGSNDIIYVGASKLYAFDPSGKIVWQYPGLADQITTSREDKKGGLETVSIGDYEITGFRSTPIIDKNGDVYFVSPAPTMNGEETSEVTAYKFSPTGELKWSTILDNNIMDPEGGTDNGGGYADRWQLSSPAFTTGQKYLISAVGNTINKVDTASGKIAWSLKPDGATGSFKASPAVDSQDNIYIGTKSNNESKFYAIRADGTGLLWRNTKITSDMYSSPLLGDDNKIYVGSESSKLQEFHALDMKTGEQAWGIDLPDSSLGSPVLYNSYIYVGVFQYKFGYSGLYKIKADANTYLTNAGWPKIFGW